MSVIKHAVLLVLLLSCSLSQENNDRCEPLNIGTCREFGYTTVRFPNELGQEHQKDAEDELAMLADFVDTGCSKDLKLFLCSLYAPYCNSTALSVRPCRDLCLNVRDRCLTTIEAKGQDWPNMWRCGRFPSEKGMCVEGLEGPVTESMSTTPLIPHPTTVATPTQPPKEDDNTDSSIYIDNTNNLCREDQLWCDNVCKPLIYRCDKYADCEDGTDEQECDKCMKNQFRCADRSQCIPIHNKCDTFTDCSDGSDEENCLGSCVGAEIFCDNNKCHPAHRKCDGNADCYDGTDEMNCPKCDADKFTCGNGRCIWTSQKCDGSDDCGDGSDETLETCPAENTDSNTDTDKPDPDVKDEENDSDYQLSECDGAKRDCNLDASCSTEMDNYRMQCGQQMVSTEMITCTKSCANALYRLRSRAPHGATLVNNNCENLGVENVKHSCIRSPPSWECIQAVKRCSDSQVCAGLHELFSTMCKDTLTDLGECKNECKQAYRSLMASPLAAGMKDFCLETNKTIPVRCGAMVQAVDSSAYSNNNSNGAHRLYAVLISLSLFYTLLSSR